MMWAVDVPAFMIHAPPPLLLSGRPVDWVVAPGTAFKRLAVNRLDGAILASMAMSDGSIYIRSHTHLYRLGA